MTLKNPCIDSNYVTISTAVLLNQVYELYENDPIGFQFTHDPFTVVTTPIAHSLCGSLSYTSTFMAATIDSTSTPVSYTQVSRTYSVYSED